ncbi:MAG: hypothetical protein H6581_19995 [Bacteroidia bacterium]|nr:hypothetical protein [Bacteroidia bacterium]
MKASFFFSLSAVLVLLLFTSCSKEGDIKVGHKNCYLPGTWEATSTEDKVYDKASGELVSEDVESQGFQAYFSVEGTGYFEGLFPFNQFPFSEKSMSWTFDKGSDELSFVIQGFEDVTVTVLSCNDDSEQWLYEFFWTYFPCVSCPAEESRVLRTINLKRIP